MCYQTRMKERRHGGLIYLSLIGLLLAIMGGIFVVWLGQGYLSARETRSWEKVSAEIIESKIGERKLGPSVSKEFCHDLVYEYQYEGKFYRGTRLKRRENPFFKEPSKISGELDRFKPGQSVDAFVNPKDPSEALIEHETKAPGYSIWFPGLFVIGGLGVFWGAILKMISLKRISKTE